MIDWFESFDIPEDLSPGERSIRIRDRYLPEKTLFDQRSANEGFLFLLFYVTLFISPETPAFFSIDNIDSSLNPKLCIALLQQIVMLAKEYGKQVIITTHNPAVLDGLDLHDHEQRLLVVERNKVGHTRVRRVDPPRPVRGKSRSACRRHSCAATSVVCRRTSDHSSMRQCVLKFGVIAEGPTDQTVIENILLGYFEDQEDEPDIRYIQPPRPLTGNARWVGACVQEPGAKGLRRRPSVQRLSRDPHRHGRARGTWLRCAEARRGNELSVSDRVDRVIARLKQDIDAGFYHANAHRILFAIAVDTIECWLLPLLYNNNKAAKTTGCLASANSALRRADQPALSAGENAFIPAYEKASSGYRRRRRLVELHERNPSLQLFIKQLETLRSRLAMNDPATSQ